MGRMVFQGQAEGQFFFGVEALVPGNSEGGSFL